MPSVDKRQILKFDLTRAGTVIYRFKFDFNIIFKSAPLLTHRII